MALQLAANGGTLVDVMGEFVLRPWEHGPMDECPICSRSPVLAVQDPGTPDNTRRYACLVCDYMVDSRQLGQLVLIRRALGTPNLLPPLQPPSE